MLHYVIHICLLETTAGAREKYHTTSKLKSYTNMITSDNLQQLTCVPWQYSCYRLWRFCRDAQFILLGLFHFTLSHRCHQQSGDGWLFCLQCWQCLHDHLNMLERVGESKHSCRTPTVVRNHSPVLPLKKTALMALSLRYLMTRIRSALILYLFMFAPKAACQTLTKALLKSMKTYIVEVLLVLKMFLTKDS